MIVKMKELWLFTLSSSVDKTIAELGKLGVVDIRETTPPIGEEIERNAEKITRVDKAIAILEKHTENGLVRKNGKKYTAVDPERITDRVLTTGRLQKRVRHALDDLQKQLAWYRTWGETIDPQDFDYLREKGVYIRLYLLDKSLLKLIPAAHHIVTFAERKDNQVPVALFARSASETLPFQEEPIPARSLAEVERQIDRKKRQLEELELYRTDQAENIALLHDYRDYLQDRLNTRKALAGMGDIEGHIQYLHGFIPQEAVADFTAVAEQEHWGYHLADPEEPEEVPVYIKNPKWISIINPVMKFIDIVPGYRELDVSIYFLVAFALFFAMLVGDAGYGAVFLLATFLVRKKLSSQMRLLIYVLSGATIVWGVLSGTYFGSERIAALPFFNNLIIPEIASFGVDNISFMMHLSFLIGAVHLTIAHSVRGVQVINSIRVLSEVGWIAFIWGLFFVVENLVLGKPLPPWNYWLFVAGTLLVALFSQTGKTFFGSMLNSLGNLPLSLINGFSDIVSYVRLFAVGMATALVASSFNDMILPQGVDLSFLEMIMAVIALLLGHGMNIVLALMAVMVHGIRLNMLEFAGHLGVQFSGEAYQPFTLKAATPERED